MHLYPAIDLRGGRVVRLAQGEADRATVYGDDPVAQAETFLAAGASWLHVVDLDRAFGTGDNDTAIAAIAAAVGQRLRVQVGGGVRTADRARALVDLGVTRVVIGTAAVSQPEVVDAAVAAVGGAAVAIGIDARDGKVAVKGWTETSAVTAHALALRVAGQGVETIVHTDIVRDGMLGGPDVDGSRALQDAARSVAPSLGVIVSGGVSSVADLRAVRWGGLAGAITGRALYDGRFTLAEALAAIEAD